MEQETFKQSKDQMTAMQTITDTCKGEDALLEKYLAAFQPKHKKYREDRCWVWTLTAVQATILVQPLGMLRGFVLDKKISIMAEKSEQSVAIEQLWNVRKGDYFD